MLTTTLAQRLRHETADDHVRAESALGLPGTVTSRGDYARLLELLLDFHGEAEAILVAARWSGDWIGVGIEMQDHSRSHLLADDLAGLGFAAPLPQQPQPQPAASWRRFASFGEALGLLYVVEGSALGGRVLGPMIRTTLGDVPTRFYDSDGRDHPRPWRSLHAALTAFEDAGGSHDDVIRGARLAFEAFETHLASPLWSSAR